MPGTEKLSDDLLELIDLFLSHGVEFLVVGAHAFAAYGYPRQTVAIDLWIERSEENASRVREALDEFGFSISDEGERQFTADRMILQLGAPPNRVDVLTFLDGCDFPSAVRRKRMSMIQGRQVPVIGLEDFVASKKASGRAKDIDDLNRLREQLGELPGERPAGG